MILHNISNVVSKFYERNEKIVDSTSILVTPVINENSTYNSLCAADVFFISMLISSNYNKT